MTNNVLLSLCTKEKITKVIRDEMVESHHQKPDHKPPPRSSIQTVCSTQVGNPQ